MRANNDRGSDPADQGLRVGAALGYEAQAEAFSRLASALDAHIARVDAASAAKTDADRSARGALDRVVKEADEKLAQSLAEIDARVTETRSQIESRHGAKSAQALAERRQAEERGRSAHGKVVARAKKDRMETVWLAETVLESTLRNAQVEQKAEQKRLEDLVSRIDELESMLSGALGPAVTARVSELGVQGSKGPAEPSFEGLEKAILAAGEGVQALLNGGLSRVFRSRKIKIEMGSAALGLLTAARAYGDALSVKIGLEYETRLRAIQDKHGAEVERADHTLRVIVKDSETKTGAAVREAYAAHEKTMGEIDAKRDRDLASLGSWQETQLLGVNERHRSVVEEARQRFARLTAEAADEYTAQVSAAREALRRVVDETGAAIRATRERAESANPQWSSMPEAPQPTEVPQVVRLADLRLDLKDRLDRLLPEIREELGLPEVIETPAVMTLPGPCSLLIEHDSGGRDQALSTVRAMMTRVLASFPAGKARFVMADPVGIGQSFAGFMRLSDHEPSPVGQKIWAEAQQIERQLADITEHMQTVIQKYLRADYSTIEDYNLAAGEIAEPYRFVVIADLPLALTDAGAGRLKSILESGPRCGVYAFVTAEAGEALPGDLQATLMASTVRLEIKDETARFIDERFDEVRMTLDREPEDRLAAAILDRVAHAGTEAGRVEVPFERLAPSEDEMWSRTCDQELVIPLGRSGAQRIQELRLGLGTRQHALIAGRTGSGKSTLLHVMITAAALWHSPDELEMYLIDFKKGVEFKAYTGGRVPHVRAVAIESDREFGLSVLKRLDDELTSRGELFRKLGAQNLDSAREMAPGEKLPRVLLMIDEFQEFFTEDDEVASEATLLLDRLVRQGRAFGVHVVLGSQTLSGAYSLARSTLGQIGVRIALQCSETDSYLILGEDNNAARLLERPGEAIYNNAGGLVEGNSPFQTAWLPDKDRDEYLAKMPDPGGELPQPVVFEGNKPARFATSVQAFDEAHPDRKVPRLLLGDAVAIAPPTSVALNRRSGANLLVVGPQSEAAMGMLASAAITFASTARSRVVFIDPTPEDDPGYGQVASVLASEGINAEVVSPRDADRVVGEIHAMVKQRSEGGGDPVLLVLGGVHRLRSLRKSDDYSFSLDEEQSSPDKDLVGILREGPMGGVWTAAWCDTLTNLERAMDRGAIREFGLRALMQMSASDSTMLLDSSAASSLGANRAILADDVAGTREKFRPVEFSAQGMDED